MKNIKKRYNKPLTKVIELASSALLADSGLKYTDKEASNEFEALSNKRYGNWDNIWSE